MKKHRARRLPKGRELEHIEGWGGPCCDCASCQRDYKWLTNEVHDLRETVRVLKAQNDSFSKMLKKVQKAGKLTVFA